MRRGTQNLRAWAGREASATLPHRVCSRFPGGPDRKPIFATRVKFAWALARWQHRGMSTPPKPDPNEPEPTPDGPQEIVDAADQELETPEDTTNEG